MEEAGEEAGAVGRKLAVSGRCAASISPAGLA